MEELYIELEDKEWPLESISHDRTIVRAVLFDDEGYFYFVQADRDDLFGKAKHIETVGGGVEEGENLNEALKRELDEELGAKVEVITKIGVVSDYYNVIHRHNLTNYYLCKALSFGDKHLTEDEKNSFHLSTVKFTYEDAINKYESCANTSIGRLIRNRELPILKRAHEIMNLSLS